MLCLVTIPIKGSLHTETSQPISIAIFFEILHNQGSQKVHGNYINSFSEKFSFGANGPFWAQKWRILITLDPL